MKVNLFGFDEATIILFDLGVELSLNSVEISDEGKINQEENQRRYNVC